ncbi:DUF6069 family protein [Nocardia sp. NPDC057668]|uniref:DUF6069 family protein n=1 Tax=Nocardia sp. NPDC057668 TaxID=3346202 RepID=UPI00366D6CF3
MSDTATASSRTLVGTGLIAVAVAAAATTLVAAVGRSAGITLVVGEAPIPLSGFAVLTGISSTAGLLLSAVLNRTTAHPRGLFVRITVGLTGLSLIPDLVVQASGPTKVLLMLTHIVAATIVIPMIAGRLPA